MSGTQHKRLQKEIADITKDTASGITILALDGGDLITDFQRLKGVFLGPPDTPYAGGRYEIEILLGSSYPFKPPKMRFITKIFHPNISSQTGAICLDTLGKTWTPVLTLKSTLISLQSLLCSPEPSDPQDAEVAQLAIKDVAEFQRVAREWAQRYAGAPEQPIDTLENEENNDNSQKERRKRRREEPDEGKPTNGQHSSTANRPADRNKYSGYKPEHIELFLDMGFSTQQVLGALRQLAWSPADLESEEELSNAQQEVLIQEILDQSH